MKIVTAEEMRAIDRATTEKYGIPSLTLMENAGTAVADFAQKHFEFSSVCVICGKGNNGGDGFVAARKLHEAGKKVSVLVLANGAEALRGDAAEMFKKLSMPALWIAEENDFSKPEIEQTFKADLIIDAILGTGFKPPLKGIAEKAITHINQTTSWVVAVDLPSGIDANSEEQIGSIAAYVHADGIISFTAAKPALVFGNLTDGPIAIASIGTPEHVIGAHAHLHEDILTSRDMQAVTLPRRPDANKGDFGHVLVIGGSVGRSGAAAMAGMAALRSGAGLVTVACPKSVQPLIAAYAPELMTEPLPETGEGTISLLALANREQLLKGKSVIVIGPGISRNEETAEFVRDLVSVCSTSMVIDADGLNAFEDQVEKLKPDTVAEPFSIHALTPHPGEMARLTGLSIGEVQSSRVAVAKKIATDTRTCVVLKGHRTVIANPEGHVWINTTGNPGMAKGGSGDVLSGIVAGLLSQIQYLQPKYRQSENQSQIDIENFSLSEIYHWISKQDPQAGEIHALRDQYRKTGTPKVLAELQSKMEEKIKKAIGLISTLNVGRAVYLHGLAGDIAASLYGQQSMIATDIINCLGEAFAVCEEESFSKSAYLQR